jgi:hypothetical protein
VAERDPKKRMRAIHRIIAGALHQPAQAYVDAVVGALNMLPSDLFVRLAAAEAKKNDFIATAVRGAEVPLHIAGARVESLFAFGPPLGAAANVTLFSYLDRAGVTINADPAAIPDHDVLLKCMVEGFDEVLKVG